MRNNLLCETCWMVFCVRVREREHLGVPIVSSADRVTTCDACGGPTCITLRCVLTSDEMQLTHNHRLTWWDMLTPSERAKFIKPTEPVEDPDLV
jgi:hypothetical protein